MPKSDPSASASALPQPLAIVLTLIMVIGIREGTWLIFNALGYPSATNIVAMVALFFILIIWRMTYGIPSWVSNASNTLLLDSGFAFLPVSAGAGLLLFALGDELWGVMITILISTLIPLWGLAKLIDIWFNRHKSS